MSEEHNQELTGLEVAIVGMACNLPGARDIDTYWRNLCDGVESIDEITLEELEDNGEDPDMIRHPDYVLRGRLIEEPTLFDAAFFGSSPREAEILDPQKRLFLECCWQALENAGYDPETYDGLVGVYAGEKLSNYMINLYSQSDVIARMGEFQVQIANDKDYLATRIAYKLSLGGPAVTVQTACSTSLVAAHLACQTLLSGECDMALAGGVAVRADLPGYMYREGEIYSRDGHIRAFDADATGTIFGNGLGVVVLKRLEDALADGDNIRAVIKGSAVNNDSNVKVGYTAPGADGQVRVIRAAQTVAEVDPATITYIETHGTGTSTGDPIEISALTRAFRESSDENQFCAIASVKSNIGHLGSAAGVAGLIKTALCLENRQLPPSINFDNPNPQIDFESSPFFVNTELRDWEPKNGAPLRAGMSAFGIGGTNAHAVLEEAPPKAPSGPSRDRQLLLLSTRTESALPQATENLADHLEANPDLDLADVAYTLQVGRKAFEHRRLLVAESREDAIEALRNEPKRLLTLMTDGRKRPLAFMFSGQGSQYAGMGHGLYTSEAVFRQEVDRCCELLEPHLGLDLRSLMYPAEEDMETAGKTLAETRYTQPALFVIEYATAKLWMSWGVTPDAMIGHSVGEYVAACMAGVFTVEEGLALVAARGRMMQELPPGDMLSVPMSEDDLLPRLSPQLSIAAINAPGRSVVSGPSEAIQALSKELRADKIRCAPLRTSHAFHSGMMEPILQPFIEEVQKVDLKEPQIPYVSNVTGKWITADEATDPSYYAKHLRGAVRFLDGAGVLLEEPDRMLLEVGPGNTLATLSSRHPSKNAEHRILSSIRHPKAKEANDLAFLLETVGQLWLSGVRPDWQAFYEGEQRRRVILPTYPFERRRFYIPKNTAAGALGFSSSSARPRKDVGEWFELPSWKPSVSPRFLEAADEESAQRWLLFLDGEGVGLQLADRLQALGHHVSTVSRGDGFNALGDGAFELSVAERDDYVKLVGALADAEALPQRVVHLWNVGGDRPEVAEAQDQGFFSLLYLTQALGRKPSSEVISLLAVSNDMQRVGYDGAESRQPEKASLLGPVLVGSREVPFLAASSVDISLEDQGDELVELLLAETESGQRGEVVVYRRGERWQRTYEPVTLDGVAEERMRLKEKGTYLITGGLGGFGLTFGEFLARDYHARLVLVGRRGLPDRGTWDDLLAADDTDERTARQIRQVRELESLGAEVLVVSADITDTDSVGKMLAQAKEHFGGLDGVIHAAGIAGGGLIQLKTADMANGVLAPKVQGTLALADALGDTSLDFFMLCSSTIAVLGTFGQVDYCGANSFMDAFAESYADQPIRPMSINWAAWRDVGMAVETQSPGFTGGDKKDTAASDAAPSEAEAGSPTAEDLGPAPEVEVEGIHPLLDRRVDEGGDATVFSTQFDVRRHWVLDEHRIVGKPAIPGTTYLELARAAFTAQAGADAGVEIEDIFFFQPLMVPAGETVEGRVILEPTSGSNGSSDYVFRVVSHAGDGPNGPRWMDHVRGKVGAGKGIEAQTFDVADMQGRFEKQFDSAHGDTFGTDDKLVYWGPRWQVLETIHLGEDEGLAKLTLAEEFRGDLEGMAMHPAMVDVATALTSGLTEGDNYLPLSYHRVRVYGDLPATIYSYLRMVGGSTSTSETVTANISLLDENGRELVAIERFAMKRVGAARERLEADDSKAEKKDEGLFAAGGMKPADGVEALRRILSRVRQPRIVVSPRAIDALQKQLAAAVPALSGAGGEGGAEAASAQETHPRPNLPVPYAAPSNDIEEALATIWQGVLGLDKVGVHDNFFDLGGDSVLGITVISQTSEKGLELSPEQLFEHQTIAELAEVLAAKEGDGASAAEEVEVAEASLSADQMDEALALLDEL